MEVYGCVDATSINKKKLKLSMSTLFRHFEVNSLMTLKCLYEDDLGLDRSKD